METEKKTCAVEADFSTILKQKLVAFGKRLQYGYVYCANVVKHVFSFYTSDKLGPQSVALTYYTFLSIVPVLALAFGITKGVNLNTEFRDIISTKFAQYNVLTDQFMYFAEAALKNASGGVIAGAGALILIFVVGKLFFYIKAAFNDIWKQPHAINNLSWFCGNLFWILLLPFILIALNAAGTFLCGYMEKMEVVFPTLTPLKQMLLAMTPVLLTMAIFFFGFWFVPDAKMRFWPVFCSAIITSIAYLLLQELFFWAQKEIFNYNTVYGSFAALPLFLVWMSLAWQIVLVGVELCHVINDYDKIMLNSKDAPCPFLAMTQNLEVAAEIYAFHHSGMGSISPEQIHEKLDIALIELQRILNILLDVGMIVKTTVRNERNEEKILYNVNLPESTSVLEAIKCISFGKPHQKVLDDTKNSQAQKVFDAFYLICEKAPENCKLYELAMKKEASD